MQFEYGPTRETLKKMTYLTFWIIDGRTGRNGILVTLVEDFLFLAICGKIRAFLELLIGIDVESKSRTFFLPSVEPAWILECPEHSPFSIKEIFIRVGWENFLLSHSGLPFKWQPSSNDSVEFWSNFLLHEQGLDLEFSGEDGGSDRKVDLDRILQNEISSEDMMWDQIWTCKVIQSFLTQLFYSNSSEIGESVPLGFQSSFKLLP